MEPDVASIMSKTGFTTQEIYDRNKYHLKHDLGAGICYRLMPVSVFLVPSHLVPDI